MGILTGMIAPGGMPGGTCICIPSTIMVLFGRSEGGTRTCTVVKVGLMFGGIG